MSSKVTIAIPTFNRVGYLRTSVDSALAQTYPNLEIVISDNCSTDGTADYLATLDDPRIVVLRQPRNLGMIGNWNECLRRATGEYFLLLSDDDLLEPQAIERLVSAIERAPAPEEIAFSHCRCWVIDKDGNPINLDPIGPDLEHINDFVLAYYLKRRECHPCGTLLRTEDVRLIGGYTQGDAKLYVDAIVWSRILQKRRTVSFVPEPFSRYRAYGSNLTTSSQVEVSQKDYRILGRVWIDYFATAPAKYRRQFASAVRGHEAWMMAVIINQSATSYLSRFRLLRRYFDLRASFTGRIGLKNLFVGLVKLFAPAFLKKPIRAFLVWKETQQRKQT